MSVVAEKVRHKAGDTFDRPWTSQDLADLRRYAPLGAEAIAEIMGRSFWAVKNQARRQRVSLRRDGETRGVLLGQPRGKKASEEAVLAALRRDVLEGTVDIARINRRIRLAALGAPLCPACTKRPQEVEATGLCEDCHLRHLAEAHRLEEEHADARRELDRERQRKHRRKKRARRAVS